VSDLSEVECLFCEATNYFIPSVGIEFLSVICHGCGASYIEDDNGPGWLPGPAKRQELDGVVLDNLYELYNPRKKAMRCPYCNSENIDQPMVDIGVGEIPAGPATCQDCQAGQFITEHGYKWESGPEGPLEYFGHEVIPDLKDASIIGGSSPDYVQWCMVIAIARRKLARAYHVSVETVFPHLAKKYYRLTKVNPETQQDDGSYLVYIQQDRVKCSCEGFQRTKDCKHIMALTEAGLLFSCSNHEQLLLRRIAVLRKAFLKLGRKHRALRDYLKKKNLSPS
jgi:transcription elongation factor Elf1